MITAEKQEVAGSNGQTMDNTTVSFVLPLTRYIRIIVSEEFHSQSPCVIMAKRFRLVLHGNGLT